MKGGKQTPGGYTIIEVMIVLAVSGAMFAIAANFINGKHANTGFRTGVQEMANKVQKVKNEVADGQYSDINLSCAFNGTSLSFPIGGDMQGRNYQCMFLGKIMHFNQKLPNTESANNYETFSIAGGRVQTKVIDGQARNNVPVTSIVDADPKPVHSHYTGNTSIDLTRQERVPQSLYVEKPIRVIDAEFGTTRTTYAIGFLQGMGKRETDDRVDLKSGLQSISLYYINGVDADKTSAEAAQLINGSSLKKANSAKICMTDGERYARLIIGNNNNELTVQVKMLGTTECPED